MFIKITNIQQENYPIIYLDQDCIISLAPVTYGQNPDGSYKEYCVLTYSVGNAVATAIVAYPPDVVAEYCLYVEQHYYNVDKFAQIKSLDNFVQDKDRPEVATVVVPPQKFEKRDRVTISNPNDPLYKEKGQIDNFQRICIYNGDKLIGLENKYQILFFNPQVAFTFDGGWYNENDLTATPTPVQETRKTEELEFSPQKFHTNDIVKIINKDQVYYFGREAIILEFQQNVKWEEGVPKRVVNRYHVSVPTSLNDGHYVWFQEWELELLSPTPSPQETPQCNGNGKAQSKEE